jgi:beta-xylosidase
MLFKFDIYYNDQLEQTLFYDPYSQEDTEAVKNRILAAVMEFRTHCIKTHTSYNTWHLINWLRKEKKIEFCAAPIASVVRVDM